MDVCPNVSVSGRKAAAGAGCQPERAPTAEFLPGENEVGDDMSLEWLSMFMEDCLSATPSYIPTPQPNPTPTVKSFTTTINNNPSVQASAISSNSMPKKRKMAQIPHHYLQAYHAISSDPPLLHQTHWLADSELIFPKKNQESEEAPPPPAVAGEEEVEAVEKEGSQQQPRRCTHCLSQKTPQWRTGPQGPKTLCNACGVRFKSGRLLPEYRPAKSPSFVSFKHSNSHKKIMEMRMALMPSPSK